ncbi:cysteine hydrolase family protein [Yersinia intermedia]|uniref:cysteine hydrolase family protein n=1 Tax=Yersinia intermedia TaxID=631 RepID=UPI0005E3D0BE|nr:isochorismatase family cysteine hydrolase [Yersinia intermedia]CND48123.1 nicotinamidase/isochorismatase family protein [Yersinia intermedia]
MNTAFIGLDYIVDIMCSGGKIARSAPHAEQRHIVEKTNKALAFARQNGWLVIHVKIGFSSGYLEHPTNSPLFGRVREYGALDLSTPGTAFHPDLDVNPSDAIVIKPRVSAFYSTSIEAYLRANNIERVVLAGVSSSWAVQSTARDAHDRDYHVVVLEDACAAATDEEHQQSMQLLATIARVTTTDLLTTL